MYTPEEETSLLEKHMGLVVKLAKSFSSSRPTELDEYVQAGRIGMLRAIRNHDPTRGKLTTLAWLCIKQEILKHINLTAVDTETTGMSNTISIFNTADNISEYLPSTLTDKEKYVILLRCRGHTFQEIGQKLGGFTRGWANRLYKSALEKIQQANS